MTKVIRRPPGKRRPRSAPMASLHLRRAAARGRWTGLSLLHRLTIRWEARRGTTRPRKWRHWGSYTNLIRVLCLLAALVVVVWTTEAILILVRHTTTDFEKWQKGDAGFNALMRFVGPFLVAGLVTAVFLFWWYRWTKRRYLAKARKNPQDLVLTAGPDTAEVVGRQEIAQVIAQRLRDRATRRPYLLVGGVGTGKTAVLVQLTGLLARQGAVPVPIRLRDAADQSDLNFEKMAKRRFCEEAPQGILARTKTERVWQQLLADDKPVVIADGLEEAILGEKFQDDRDNIIRRAIERADDEKLPLVIATRPHTPLEGTRAAIIELEPLSEEAALEFVEADAPEADERRLDWIVETAEVTESPIYLQIARELNRHDALDHDRPRPGSRRLDTRSRDRSALRLWLLETWADALLRGRLRSGVVLGEQDRRDTLEVVSALACVGLLQDKLEVRTEDLLGARLHPTRTQSLAVEAEHVWAMRPGPDPHGRRGDALTEWHRRQIWDGLCARLSTRERRRLCEGTVDECHAALARCVANADALDLVEGFEKKVRFPHSILQAYFGHRMLHHLGEGTAHALVERALQPPGPGRELLIALVMLSRRRAADAGPPAPGVVAAAKEDLRQWWRRAPLTGRSLTRRLLQAADRRDDPKALDLYAAALEIECVRQQPELLSEIVSALKDDWHSVKGGRRTLDEAKLRAVKQLGAALRTAGRTINTTPLYLQMLELGVAETSYSIRLAVAQECGNGGDLAFGVIRKWIGDINRDPLEEYEAKIEEFRAEKRERLDKWAGRMQNASATTASPRGSPEDGRDDELNRERRDILENYRKQREKWWREFVMRCWMLPMLLGSVSEDLREEARNRLNVWLRHLDPAYTRGVPDLPMSMECALAQGFKYAANRRKRHLYTDPGGRKDLIRQAETMLRRTRCWYAQLSLLQALCLWELPDSAARHRGNAFRDPRRDGGRAAPGTSSPDGTRPTTAVQTVRRWLAMAGTDHAAAAGKPTGRRAARLPLHPFVAETGDLVALALETRRPERYLWIDEKGVADTIGSRAGGSQSYRKHHLWIPPSVGWSTLDARAQCLVADVLVMLNLIERDGQPDEVEDRLNRSQQPAMPLPPCITTDRRALCPELKAGTSGPPVPGSTCLANCPFQFCPYPPRGTRSRAEIREPFCRQQQALLPGRLRRLPRLTHRRTPDWVGMGAPELHGFWEDMAHRMRG
ncbi:ATP-binding protein [Streptomyces sp. UNOB3_S3]|uniref:ATP-binding protein n=1 Tax=Streptomyces sp. UNOB3_S3 TaxID=2871682 RepID=UPI001E52B89C|nr:ATP-binding protein [Streptomyces sp. UNOB3_S3]MCC3778452.1 ATP-binding protein [Streptomyces sp. UNOB3_S3]